MITVVSPILNEAYYLPAWCRNVARYASQVVVYDMGSTDGSQEIIESFGFELHTAREKTEPYKWVEGEVRGRLRAWAKCPWIVRQDADELMGPEWFAAKDELVKTWHPVIRFAQYRFWLSPNLIRVRSLDNLAEWRRFYPNGTWNKMYRKSWVWYDENEGNHAPPRFLGLPKVANRLVELRRLDIPVYHFHMTEKPHAENRTGTFHDQVKCMTYFGPYPEEIKYYKDLAWLP